MAGKPRPLTELQQAHLENAQKHWSAYRKVRDEAYDRAKLQADAEVAVAKTKAASAARDATASGVSMRRIGHGIMKTSDYRTVRAFLDLADPIAVAIEEFTPANPNIKLTPILDPVTDEPTGQFTVVLSGDELVAAKDRAEWSGILPSALCEAIFERHESGKFIAVTDGWVAEHQTQHPVVAWADLPSSQEKLTEVLEKGV